MKKRFLPGLAAALLFSLAACGKTAQDPQPDAADIASEASVPGISALPERTAAPASEAPPQSEAAGKLQIEVNGQRFTAVWEDNEAAAALAERLPLTILMSDYSGFEKVGALGQSLPASDTQTITQPGDIVLYNSAQIVLFYGSNSWSYTRLAHVEDLSGWAEALGSGDVTVTFSA